MSRLPLPLTATFPLLAALAGGFTATSAAPGTAQGTADSEASLVQQRARDLWNAKVTDRWDVVFDYLPPEEQAQTQGRDAYAEYQKSGGPFQYTAAEVGEAIVEGDVAWVALKFAVKPRQYPLKPSDVEKWEVWIKRDDWRPVPRAAEDQFPSRPPKARDTEEDARLTARVDAVWKATERDDWRAVYDFLDPGYRAANNIEQHMARRAKYLYSSTRIRWVETQGNVGRAKVSFMQKLNDPSLTKLEPEEKMLVEQWFKVDGQWFRSTKPAQESK
jgi:hypothetical protein